MDDKVKEQEQLAQKIKNKLAVTKPEFQAWEIVKLVEELGYVKPQPSLKFERISDEDIYDATHDAYLESQKNNPYGDPEASAILQWRAIADAQALSDEKQLAQHLAGIGKDVEKELLTIVTNIDVTGSFPERVAKRKELVRALSALLLAQKGETAREIIDAYENMLDGMGHNDINHFKVSDWNHKESLKAHYLSPERK